MPTEITDEMAERLAFAVEDYLVRMHGIVSSQRAAEFAPMMLRYALGLVPEGENWMSTGKQGIDLDSPVDSSRGGRP